LEAVDATSGFHKVGHVALSEYFGIKIAALPHMGAYRPIAAGLSPHLFRASITEFLRGLISPSTEAVIEIGCGVGDIIVSAARDNLGRPTRFIASDLSGQSYDCVEILSELARVDNVEFVAFDILKPDYGFLLGAKNPIFFTANVFSALGKNEVASFLTSLPSGARLCAFEPLHNQIEADFPDHKIVEHTPNSRTGKNTHTWQEMKEAPNAAWSRSRGSYRT
jgi:hypothetical protein